MRSDEYKLWFNKADDNLKRPLTTLLSELLKKSARAIRQRRNKNRYETTA